MRHISSIHCAICLQVRYDGDDVLKRISHSEITAPVKQILKNRLSIVWQQQPSNIGSDHRLKHTQLHLELG